MSLKNTVAAKLHPTKVRVSGKFSAILACILGQKGWTSPSLAELCITSDGFLMGRQTRDCGFNEILGTKGDLERNLRGVAEVAELTHEETNYLLRLMPKEM